MLLIVHRIRYSINLRKDKKYKGDIMMSYRKINISTAAIHEAAVIDELVEVLESAGAYTGEFDTIDDVIDYVEDRGLKGIALNDKNGLDIDEIQVAFKAHGIKTTIVVKETV